MKQLLYPPKKYLILISLFSYIPLVFIFLLNIPMGGMIMLMIRTNSGFSYPGYIIYLSALYTFYSFIISIKNIVKYRKVGSSILSSAKVLNFISAMIAHFSSHGEAYRKMMNMITGGVVYGSVVLIAIYMLNHSKNLIISNKEKNNI